MPLESLRCKVCGGLLDEKLKCKHCGTLHIKGENGTKILRVCSKHSIGYSSNECPKCREIREEKENEKENQVITCLARAQNKLVATFKIRWILLKQFMEKFS